MLIGPTLASSCSKPARTSLQDLFDEQKLDYEKDELECRQKLGELLTYYRLEITPTLGRGSMLDERVVQKQQTAEQIDEHIREIEMGESHVREFKSTFMVDLKKLHHNSNFNEKQCISEAVIHSTLKNVAAFMNTEGGDIYIGVADNGNIIGLESDLAAIDVAPVDFDAFDLRFRSQILKNFYNGAIVDTYVRSQQIIWKENFIVKIQVTHRPGIVFMKGVNGATEIYIRRGTSAHKIEIQDIQSYYILEKSF